MTTIRIMSAGGVKQGLRNCVEKFCGENGLAHGIQILPGPEIQALAASDSSDADLIAIPRPGFDDLIAAGKVKPEDVALLGFVTVGVTVRNGAREPDLGSVESFVDAVLAAERIIYNTASSGQYVAKTFEMLGLGEKIRDKIVVLPTGTAAMEAVAADISGNAIGFGHATEIRLHDSLGTHFVGPLPDAIGRQTSYAIGVLARSSRPAEARKMAAFMVSPAGRRIFLDTGVLQSE